MSRKRILIIDDETNFCKVVKLNLERSGDFVVYTATNAKEGVNLAKKIQPNLILLDIIMPVLDGFKVLKKLKKDKDTLEIPVIMLSALKDDMPKLKAAQLYDEAYITKPIESSDLKNEIEKVLKRKGIK